MLSIFKKEWGCGFPSYGRARTGLSRGLSLIELLIASSILIIAISGILISYIRCIELNEVSKNLSVAVRAAKNQMEQIKATPFASIKSTFHNTTFTVSGLNGRGVAYIDDTNPKILRAAVSVSWQQKNGRTYGEDANLNGSIDAGEDANGNGELDSPVQLINYIYNR